MDVLQRALPSGMFMDLAYRSGRVVYHNQDGLDRRSGFYGDGSDIVVLCHEPDIWSGVNAAGGSRIFYCIVRGMLGRSEVNARQYISGCNYKIPADDHNYNGVLYGAGLGVIC